MRTTLIAAAFAALALSTGAAHAGERGYVVAHSDFGNGSVRAPVRYTSVGPQVRLPGGSWIDCRQTCSETLRVNTVDIGESSIFKGRDATTSDVHLFGKLQFGW